MMKKLKDLSDNELVKNICNLDQENYRFLVERYRKKINSYLFFLIRDDFLAKEATQEAFIKAFINLKSFNFNFKFSSWIFRIAHNEAINLVRQNKNKISLGENDYFFNLEQIQIKKTKLEDDFFLKTEKENLLRNLDKLKIKYKEVLVLYFFEDKSYIEIGDILRMNIKTVATRISRAKTNLKELLIKQEDFYEK
jgi:RNA polymerase sigma-70 factor (ECF subfamily)